jgi:hypothetical protein
VHRARALCNQNSRRWIGVSQGHFQTEWLQQPAHLLCSQGTGWHSNKPGIWNSTYRTKPACNIYDGTVRAIRNWRSIRHLEHWKSGYGHAKLLIPGPTLNRTGYLLSFSKKQLKSVAKLQEVTVTEKDIWGYLMIPGIRTLTKWPYMYCAIVIYFRAHLLNPCDCLRSVRKSVVTNGISDGDA